ncbi:MAG: nitrate reductase cytochrome c-type subunit [Gemmataceae bacterium]
MSDNINATLFIPGIAQRYATLTVVVVLGVVLVGFLRGVREPPPVSRLGTGRAPAISSAQPALRYNQLPFPRPDERSQLASLNYEMPGVFDRVVRTEEMRQQALADRARNRAYDGAPPTIPHGTDQMTTASCLLCHGQGIRVADRIASKISHPHYPNCTQCHVEMSRLELDRQSSTTVVDNKFVGAYRSGPGGRASPGAPPTIPHSTWLRQDCLSCHGLLTRPGTRTTHPWLTSCTQCHAPSAALDQAAFQGHLP